MEPVYDLYAAGFNAHHQLCFEDEHQEAPADRFGFEKIVSGKSVKVFFACWSETVSMCHHFCLLFYWRVRFCLVRCKQREASSKQINDPNSVQKDDSLYLLGQHRPTAPVIRIEDDSPGSLTSPFGDHNGLLGAIGSRGRLFLLCRDDPACPILRPYGGDGTSPALSQVALAGNGRVAVVPAGSTDDSLVMIFCDLNAVKRWHFNAAARPDPESDGPSDGADAPKSYTIPAKVKQLQAGATFFVLLTVAGAIHSWGDARYASRTLGRVVDASQEAEVPGFVDALGGVEIAKVVVCRGWIVAVLSLGGDGYFWGGREKVGVGREGREEGEEEEGKVSLVEIEDLEDIRDVGAGEGHLVVLGERGRVFVLGDGVNGQLGTGRDRVVSDWVEVEGLKDRRIGQVFCGDRCSFVVVERKGGD